MRFVELVSSIATVFLVVIILTRLLYQVNGHRMLKDDPLSSDCLKDQLSIQKVDRTLGQNVISTRPTTRSDRRRPFNLAKYIKRRNLPDLENHQKCAYEARLFSSSQYEGLTSGCCRYYCGNEWTKITTKETKRPSTLATTTEPSYGPPTLKPTRRTRRMTTKRPRKSTTTKRSTTAIKGSTTNAATKTTTTTKTMTTTVRLTTTTDKPSTKETLKSTTTTARSTTTTKLIPPTTTALKTTTTTTAKSTTSTTKLTTTTTKSTSTTKESTDSTTGDPSTEGPRKVTTRDPNAPTIAARRLYSKRGH